MSQTEHDLSSGSKNESAGKSRTKRPINGWLDRRRRMLEVLEEAVENARKEAQAKKGRGHDNESRLEWTKTLHRLLETYDLQLERIKHHLWGNPARGDIDEPGNCDNGIVEFERSFQHCLLDPWTSSDLKLKCEDCGTLSEEVSTRTGRYQDEKDRELCDKCYGKRTAKEPDRS